MVPLVCWQTHQKSIHKWHKPKWRGSLRQLRPHLCSKIPGHWRRRKGLGPAPHYWNEGRWSEWLHSQVRVTSMKGGKGPIWSSKHWHIQTRIEDVAVPNDHEKKAPPPHPRRVAMDGERRVLCQCNHESYIRQRMRQRRFQCQAKLLCYTEQCLKTSGAQIMRPRCYGHRRHAHQQALEGRVR